jgi:hypothetical protein
VFGCWAELDHRLDDIRCLCGWRGPELPRTWVAGSKGGG